MGKPQKSEQESHFWGFFIPMNDSHDRLRFIGNAAHRKWEGWLVVLESGRDAVLSREIITTTGGSKQSMILSGNGIMALVNELGDAQESVRQGILAWEIPGSA